MPKLYFKYGAMNSSKSANALMVKFNYEEQGYRVALLKPSIDDRDGTEVVKSRIGLEQRCYVIDEDMNLLDWYDAHREYQVLIVDEAQFLTPEQVEQLKDLAVDEIPVLCFGLKTDFQTKMFPASKRLFELADSLSEIKSVCRCGRKAEVNARIHDGAIIKEGKQILIGGTERYVGMCYKCWRDNRFSGLSHSAHTGTEKTALK